MKQDDAGPLPVAGGHYKLWKRTGNTVYVAGQVPRDASRKVIGHTIEEQTRAVLENLRHVLADAGVTFTSLVRVQAYLADIDHFERFNAVYADVLGEASPVRTTIGCHLNGVLVEVDAIAEMPGNGAEEPSGEPSVH